MIKKYENFTQDDIKKEIENALRTTLVIGNKQSIHYAVDKIITIFADFLKKRINQI